MKKAGDMIIGSWDNDNVHKVDHDGFQGIGPDEFEFDNAPIHPLDSGPVHNRHMKETDAVTCMMVSLEWTEPKTSVQQPPTSFTSDKIIPGVAWEQEIDAVKQRILDKKNEHYITPDSVGKLDHSGSDTPRVANVVKVIDKSYLDHDFRVEGVSHVVDSTVKKFFLNKEQERAFRIVANHAISPHHDQLQMYLGGMGGTGKSQVIKALSYFFTTRKQAHHFIIVALTGAAAALLSGSTYHSMFGINDRGHGRNLGKIKANLDGVEYVFFDEVSMLSVRDMF